MPISKIIQSIKIGFGLFGLITTISSFASSTMGESSTGTLLLRGKVPDTTSVDWGDREHGDKPVVKFNGRVANAKVKVTEKKDGRRITIIHP